MSATKNMKKTNKTKVSEKTTLSFQVPREMGEQFQTRVQELDMDGSKVLRRLLRDYLTQQKVTA